LNTHVQNRSVLSFVPTQRHSRLLNRGPRAVFLGGSKKRGRRIELTAPIIGQLRTSRLLYRMP
jgi:hypothetical protein